MGGLAVNKNKINTPFFSFKKPFIKCQLYPLLMLSFFNQTNIDNMTRGVGDDSYYLYEIH
jgi:hypothetical protein